MVFFSLTFVRHGETLYNRKNIIQGQTDVPLSGVGEKQAQLVADRLQRDRFTHIFASDLSRAHETARIIADANKVCRCDIIVEKRLRERKFGAAEGKSSKELILSAKKAKRKFTDYTPVGAETVLQVQDRAQSFFNDLCKLCMEYAEAKETLYTPGKIKRRHGGSLGRNSGSNKRLEICRRSQSFCGSGNIQNIINEMNVAVDYDDEDEDDDDDINENNVHFCKHSDCACRSGHCSVSAYVSMQDRDDSGKVIGEEYQYRECFPSSSDDSNLSSDLKSCSSSGISSHSGLDDGEPQHSEHSPLNIHDSDSTLSDSENHHMSYSSNHSFCEIQSDSDTKRPSFMESPESVGQTINSNSKLELSLGCPNVSLSPISQKRLPSISSISSGRNSSFDDLDRLPSAVADVLVVSHGGFIKETMRYFVENLDCKIPGARAHAFKVCPNCSVSKFTVELDEDTGKPSLTCITLHDKDHLADLDLTDAKGLF